MGSPTINNLSPCVQTVEAALANITTYLPDSLHAVQQLRQLIINVLIIWTQNPAEVTRGWHCYLGGDTGCALQAGDFWSVLMKSYPDRLQNPWNKSSKMMLKSSRDVLLACASALCARSTEKCAGSAIVIALLYFTDTILYLLKSLPLLK